LSIFAGTLGIPLTFIATLSACVIVICITHWSW
jgi:hypothetical protein